MKIRHFRAESPIYLDLVEGADGSVDLVVVDNNG